MDQLKPLPIGTEYFKQIRERNCYYVDKTGLIRELLEDRGEITLFTRPRRFGKSLNMNTLQYFFEYGCNAKLFEGLEIAKETLLCEEYMGKSPVVSITLKDVGTMEFQTAKGMLRTVIGDEAMRFQFLQESQNLSALEKEKYRLLIETGKHSNYAMSDDVLMDSLRTLCGLLFKHYGKQVILLVDEYDVPLDKAQHYGYYDEMVNLIRVLLGRVLKTNPTLLFAVLTGCLRIAKESIFTGLNNLKVFSVMDARYSGYFGFSDAQVREMLQYYGFEEKYEVVKEWYDGYHFGNSEVYCPWDVNNYVDLLRHEPDARPRPFWINTSGNDIIRRFLKETAAGTKRELEQLINGGSVRKKINQELTYRDLYSGSDNLWSVLFMTGYLTSCGNMGEDGLELRIPNLEIRKIFISQFMEWFQGEVRKDTAKLDEFCEAFLRADVSVVEKSFSTYLSKTISIRDTSVRRSKKENFYHGILLGLLSHRQDWWIRSNVESGDGFSDILIETEDQTVGIVVEVKYPESANLTQGCQEALEQIKRMGYDAKLREDEVGRIIHYGIACNKKKCKVMAAESEGIQ